MFCEVVGGATMDILYKLKVTRHQRGMMKDIKWVVGGVEL